MDQTTFEILNTRELLPAEPTPRRLVEIEIDTIECDNVGPAPTNDLIKSIRARGVQTPISILQVDDSYYLISGRRRLLAAIECGFTAIPAIIHQGIEPDSAALTDHALRHRNPAGELRSIERLMEAGHNEFQIAAATGMTVGTIRARLKLQALSPILRAAFEGSQLALQTAEQIVKLGPVAQAELVEHYLKYASLTTKDVKERRHVQRETAVASLPLFDEMVTEERSDVKRATLDEYIASSDCDPQSVADLARIGLVCIETGRLDDAREIFQRIVKMSREG